MTKINDFLELTEGEKPRREIQSSTCGKIIKEYVTAGLRQKY